jgi:hypothetical protein
MIVLFQEADFVSTCRQQEIYAEIYETGSNR